VGVVERRRKPWAEPELPLLLLYVDVLQVVDTGLNESKRFLQYLAVALVVAYFGLVKLMYK
jgi:hypothetical protein